MKLDERTKALIAVGASAASQGLGRLAVLVVRPAALETLAQIQQIVFDKTGTLTDGRIRITRTALAPGYSAEQALASAATLEREATHPIARAFASDVPLLPASQRRQIAGQGVEAVIQGQRYRLGRADFALDGSSEGTSRLHGDVHLSVDGRAMAAFTLEDQLRADAVDSLRELRAGGCSTVLLSGDSGRRRVGGAAV